MPPPSQLWLYSNYKAFYTNGLHFKNCDSGWWKIHQLSSYGRWSILQSMSQVMSMSRTFVSGLLSEKLEYSAADVLGTCNLEEWGCSLVCNILICLLVDQGINACISHPSTITTLKQNIQEQSAALLWWRGICSTVQWCIQKKGSHLSDAL
jgi:hypothetical protein